MFGLLWQVWALFVLTTAAVTGSGRVLPARVVAIVGLPVLGFVLISYLPLSAHGGSRSAGYEDAIGELIINAATQMSFAYACAIGIAGNFVLWLLARRRETV